MTKLLNDADILEKTNNPDIIAYRNIIVDTINPDKIILFGSYAYGAPTDKSDIDLCVIKNGKDYTINDQADFSSKIWNKKNELNIKTYPEVCLENEEWFNTIADRGYNAFSSARNKGVLIYERDT